MWENPQKAQEIMQERTRLANRVDQIRSLETTSRDHVDMIALAEEEGDAEMVADSETALTALQARLEKLQLQSLLDGEADPNSAFLTVHAGSGGTEAQDWASMLLRMYMRWAEAHDYKITLMERSEGEEAGIKSATLKIDGENAYGWLKTENGVHRLVRISPFDSNARRHTSFASVSVSPVIDDTIAIEIDEKDLKIDTYRSSGAGGQHVNTTDSAVRITHQPTGVVVACQNERSQHKNRDQAMAMLKARLYEIELQRREDDKAAAHGEKTDIGWGHQIRSYVLHPYQMVKDLRTGHESTDSGGVLDGDIDGFLEASLSRGLDEKTDKAS